MSYKTDHCTIARDCLGDFCFHHIKTQGSNGPDIEENLLPVCTKHHNEAHCNFSKFVENHPVIKYWLKKNGWEVDPISKKWINYKVTRIANGVEDV